MDKLRTTIVQHTQWDFLESYIDRIETYIESDFSLSFENAKSLLEAVGKEICIKCGKDLKDKSTINGVMKQAFQSLGYSNSDMVKQVSSSLATIGQQIGNLRNDIGTTSHGKSAEEIKERNAKVDVLTREFLIDTIEIVCQYLIKNYEIKSNRVAGELLDDTINYEEKQEFNQWWDEQFGEFDMGEYSYPASEILFSVDKQAYLNENKQFNESETT